MNKSKKDIQDICIGNYKQLLEKNKEHLNNGKMFMDRKSQYKKYANSSKCIYRFNKNSIKNVNREFFPPSVLDKLIKMYRVEQKVKNSQDSPEEEKVVSGDTSPISYQATANTIVLNWCKQTNVYWNRLLCPKQTHQYMDLLQRGKNEISINCSVTFGCLYNLSTVR